MAVRSLCMTDVEWGGNRPPPPTYQKAMLVSSQDECWQIHFFLFTTSAQFLVCQLFK
jgi:hypothetical protein